VIGGNAFANCTSLLRVTWKVMKETIRMHHHALFFFLNGILVKLRDRLETTFFWGGLGGAPTGYRPALGGDTLELQEIVHGAMGF
jgi:hypothetical protein